MSDKADDRSGGTNSTKYRLQSVISDCVAIKKRVKAELGSTHLASSPRAATSIRRHKASIGPGCAMYVGEI